MMLSKSMRAVLSLCAVCTAVIVFWSCEYPKGAPTGNSAPETRISNIPQNDTIAQYISLGAIPEITLYWLGDDPDGFVVAFKYRWIDFYRGNRIENPPNTVLNLVSVGGVALQNMIMVRGTPKSVAEIYRFFSTLTQADTALINRLGDSLATFRPFAVPYKTGVVPGDSLIGARRENHVSPTTGKYIFDSPADSNMHRFEVAAMDNNGETDLTPAIVNFWTLKSPRPEMRITNPIVNTQISSGLVDTNQLAIRNTTDDFRGLRIDFGALDPSTFDIVYSWAVDDTVNASSWSPWTENTTAFVTASSFKPPTTGWHVFYVRARNRWGVLSNIARARFRAIVPQIDSIGYMPRTLIINNNINGNGTLGRPDSSQIRSFYSEVMDSLGRQGKYDIWTVVGQPSVSKFPSIVQLGRYSSVIYLHETRLVGLGLGLLQFDVDRKNTMRNYVRVGGNLIFSGPIDTVGMPAGYDSLSIEFFRTTPSQFFRTIGLDRRVNNRDCIGSTGRLGYPNLPIDAAKLPADSTGAIRFVLLNAPAGFSQTIGTFNSLTNDPRYQGQSIGVRFLSPSVAPPLRKTYSVVQFGIPLYFVQKSSVIQALRKAFDDLQQ